MGVMGLDDLSILSASNGIRTPKADVPDIIIRRGAGFIHLDYIYGRETTQKLS